MKISKKLLGSTDFSTKFLINSLASWDPPNPLQMKISKFLPKFSRKIREKFQFFLKKWQNFHQSYQNMKILPKYCKFLFFFEIFCGVRGARPPGPGLYTFFEEQHGPSLLVVRKMLEGKASANATQKLWQLKFSKFDCLVDT